MKKMIGIFCAVAVVVLIIAGISWYTHSEKGNEKETEKEEVTEIEIDDWVFNEEEKLSILDYNLDDYVKLGEYTNLAVDINYTEVNEDYITDIINQTLQNYPEYEKAQKVKVENGDVVNIDYVGKIDGEEFEGGSAQGAHLTIGSNQFIEGFESGLIGVKTGTTIELNLTFPEDYHEELAGKDVVFTVTVNAIETEKILTYEELTDEFVDENLGFETIEDLHDYVRDYYQDNADSQKESDTRTAVIDAVMDVSSVELPKDLLTSKVKEYLASFKEGVESSGSTLDEYLSTNYNSTQKEFQKEVTSMMQESLKEQMLLYAIATKEGIEKDEEGFNEYVESFVNYYGYDSKDALYEDYPEDELSLAYTCNMVVDYLVENSTINYVSQEEK